MAENKSLLSQLGITPIQAAAATVILGGGYALGRKLGLIKGEENEKQAKLSAEKMFEPGYLTTIPAGTKYYKFSSAATVPEIAEKLYKAKGFFHDDMPQLWGAIKRMKYKTEVAQVNTYFNQKYKKEMMKYLETFLNADEMAEIYDYLAKLPSGFL